MIKIAICDDNNYICSEIEEVILDFEKTSTIEMDIEVFYTGENLIKFIKNEHKFDFISRMSSSNKTVTLVSNGIELFDQYNPAIGYQIDSYQEVFKNTGTTGGHEIILQPVSKSVESGTGYGVMQTSWDVYYVGNIIDGEYQGSDSFTLDSSYRAS